jgi:dihydrofolate synthase/folylpolyglutamate synthase
MRSHPVLDQLGMTGIRLGLDNVRAFLNYLGEPHRAFPVVHVAGTNGKGSVCMYVTEALVRAGYRVGTNLSPHLEDVNERVRIDGKPVDDAQLVDAIEALDRDRFEWARSSGVEGQPLTYFEFMTVLAFRMFAEMSVQVAVIEVGMGGRLDATNVVYPQVCAIPSIGWDHMEHLGDTIAKIAAEKAGVIKRGVPVVTGVLPPDAREVIEARARGVGAPLWRPGADLMREQRRAGWNLRTPVGGVNDVKLSLEGAHQGGNALVALGVLHRLRQQGFLIPDEAIKEGFEAVRFPGRIETLAPGLIVDGAHNPDGANVLAAWLAARARPKSRILLLGHGVERDPVAFLQPLIKHFDEIVATNGNHPHARPSHNLADVLRDVPAVLSDGGPIAEALPEIYQEADETIVTGSLYLVGQVRSLVRQGALAGLSPGRGPVDDDEPS